MRRGRAWTGAGVTGGAVLLLAAAAPAGLAGQAVGVIRGAVVTDSGAPVPHALVELQPGRRIFADGRGAFAFAALAPGRYALTARQVGFHPADTVVTPGERAGAVRLVLRRLPVTLAAIAVEAEGPCRGGASDAPGRGAPLAAVFAQLFENAARFQLLADEYPFTYRMERTAADYDVRDVAIWRSRDTIEVRSEDRFRYRPGDLLRPGLGPGGRPARVVQVPQLPDLADSAFRARHCFRWGGDVPFDGASALLIEFRAAEPLLSVDVDGRAWLDPASYQVRRIAVELVPALAIPGVLAITMTVDFREVQPGVLVPHRIVTRTTLATRAGEPLRRQEEEQRLLRVHFRRPLE